MGVAVLIPASSDRQNNLHKGQEQLLTIFVSLTNIRVAGTQKILIHVCWIKLKYLYDIRAKSLGVLSLGFILLAEILEHLPPVFSKFTSFLFERKFKMVSIAKHTIQST